MITQTRYLNVVLGVLIISVEENFQLEIYFLYLNIIKSKSMLLKNQLNMNDNL